MKETYLINNKAQLINGVDLFKIFIIVIIFGSFILFIFNPFSLFKYSDIIDSIKSNIPFTGWLP